MDICEDDDEHPYHNLYSWASHKSMKNGKSLWYGSFASYLYQDVERSVLNVIISEINEIAKEKYIDDPIGSLIHDGLHVKKSLGISEHLSRITDRIEFDTGYLIGLTIKPMVQEKLSDGNEIGYQTLKEEFEKTRFKTREGKQPFYTIYPKKNEIVASNKTDFSVLHENWIPTGGYKFLKQWFDDGTMRMYDYVDYSCVREEDKQPNIYYAFPELRFNTLASPDGPREATSESNIDFLMDYLKLVVEDNDSFVKWITCSLAR